MTEETEIQIAPEAVSENRQQKQVIVTVFVILLVLFLDQLLKFWVKKHMFLGEEKSLIGDWALLHFTENNGIAFGYELPGTMGKLFLTSFRIIAAGFIFYYLMKLIRKGIPFGLVVAGALVFAGATGNIFDSVFYGQWFKQINLYEAGWLHGRVVDMLYFPLVHGHFPKWLPVWGGEYFEFFRPVFNLADASITVGIFMILLFYRKSLKEL